MEKKGTSIFFKNLIFSILAIILSIVLVLSGMAIERNNNVKKNENQKNDNKVNEDNLDNKDNGENSEEKTVTKEHKVTINGKEEIIKNVYSYKVETNDDTIRVDLDVYRGDKKIESTYGVQPFHEPSDKDVKDVIDKNATKMIEDYEKEFEVSKIKDSVNENEYLVINMGETLWMTCISKDYKVYTDSDSKSVLSDSCFAPLNVSLLNESDKNMISDLIKENNFMRIANIKDNTIYHFTEKDHCLSPYYKKLTVENGTIKDELIKEFTGDVVNQGC